MTLSFFLLLSGTQPCQWEKGDPQLTTNAEEGRGRSSALCGFLGWERKLPRPLLLISLADRSQQRQETEKPGLSSTLPAVPHVKGCWWGKLLRPLLPRSPQVKCGAHNKQHSSRSDKPMLCSALGCPVRHRHPSFPYLSFKLGGTR